MFNNFIKLAFRNFIKSPLTSFIELFGMTAGLTVFLLILLWVFHETSYDKFHENADNIYRLELVQKGNKHKAGLYTIIKPLLEENFPEIEKVVRFRHMSDYTKVYKINSNKTKDYFETSSRLHADQEFFDIFSVEFVFGNPKTALKEKNTVVITESLSETLFGLQNPIGETIFDEEHNLFTVSGVIKDVSNFHIPFTMLRDFEFINQGIVDLGLKADNWIIPLFPTYVMLNSKQDISQLEKRISKVIDAHRPENLKKANPDLEFHLRPLTDIYFNSRNVENVGYAVQGDRKKVVAYSAVAIFMLLLAIINFINLNSSKSLERAKEVGIKKVVGASRVYIIVQFLGEVVILCIIALVLAFFCTASFIPTFNNLMHTQISLSQLLQPWIFTSMLLGIVLISLISGGFPALYLSSFKPVAVIKGLPVSTGKKISFKKMNLAVQFAITIFLIVGSITILNQINFMKDADLGLKTNHRLVFPFNSYQFNKKSYQFNHKVVEVLKNKLLSNPNINNLSYSYAIPGKYSENHHFREVTFNGNDYNIAFTVVDEGYLETLGLELVEGRFFEKNRAGDFISVDSTPDEGIKNIVLNESAVNMLGLENPVGAVGTSLFFGKQLKIRVIGVLKDFHLNALSQPILPMVYTSTQQRYFMIADISSVNMPSTVQFVKTEVENLTKSPPDIEFLDEVYNKQYREDENFASLIGYFTILAILIACMGLFGVATHTIKLRLKEIGIRKTLGASSWVILKLITIYFLKILLFSIFIAIPIVWFAMHEWLNNYAYRIELTIWVLVLGCTLTIAIALLTIIWKSWQASNINPVKLIKYE
ncbi:ABC transporter permease [Aestuariivivens sp. NBU2969]|uniref:ABC transporter permease n=1 Tax=Aestuariivivens sp. NBU2969 TaxID=2873267 RepID=UPI001CBF3BAC|nr:ABC transporter permease [Aestuariivivens sp. NBU2969]